MKTNKTTVEHTILVTEQRVVSYNLELSKEEAVFLLLLTGRNSLMSFYKLLKDNCAGLTEKQLVEMRTWADSEGDPTHAVYTGLKSLLND